MERPVRLTLELHPSGEPILGRLWRTDEDAAAVEFSGYVGLISALEKVRANARRSPAGEAGLRKRRKP